MDEINKDAAQKIQLEKVVVVGQKYFHVFEGKEGVQLEEETTEQDYLQLASPGHKDPAKKGYTWKRSYTRYKFDTPDGNMADNQYHDNGLLYQAKVSGKLIDIEKNKIADNKVDTSEVNSALVKAIL